MEEIPLLSAKDLLSFLDSISLEMNKKAKDDTIGPGSGGCDTIIAGQRLLQE